MSHSRIFSLWSLLSLLLAISFTPLIAAEQAPKPNILIILADDLGYSDLGCYGSEIQTPHLDQLAQNGLRFTQCYNTARCWPSRAALLTGYYPQQIGRDALPSVTGGSAGIRPSWAKLLPEYLKPLGYRSYHSGKWHIDGLPLQNGFDHSYRLEDHNRNFNPQEHSEDDKPLPPIPPGTSYYSSTAITDHSIKCLREHADKYPSQPFFGYVAFTVPHFPLQAPEADIKRYLSTYLPGWERLREARWTKMHSLGLGGESLSPFERTVGPPHLNKHVLEKLGPDELLFPVEWSQLNSTQQAFQATKMAIHAAMVDRMDQEIGRILDQLRSMQAFENTLILFMSDNGASAEILVRGDGHDPHAPPGSAGSFLSLGPGWSTHANTPFRRHKTWVHEGGIATPFIAHWPQGIKTRGELRQTPAHLIDILPTLFATLSLPLPNTSAPTPIPPPPGKNLLPAFNSDTTIERDSIWWLHEGNRALRVGDWKIVSTKNYGDDQWELYNLAHDRSESQNLATQHPDKLRELTTLWHTQTTNFSKLAQNIQQNP